MKRPTRAEWQKEQGRPPREPRGYVEPSRVSGEPWAPRPVPTVHRPLGPISPRVHWLNLRTAQQVHEAIGPWETRCGHPAASGMVTTSKPVTCPACIGALSRVLAHAKLRSAE